MVLPLVLGAFVMGRAAAEEDAAEKRQVVTAVSRLLEQGHYTREKLNDEMSAKFLDSYLRLLDYNRLYFLQSDIDEFKRKYGTTLDDSLLRGDLEPASAIYNRFKQRLEARIKSNLERIPAKQDYTSSRTVQINRQKAEWPKDQADADQLWADRLEAELLQEELSKSREDSPAKILTRRYNQILRNIHEQDEEDIIKTYLSALAQTYDPHSDYMSPSDMENFSISMRLSLVGVGAVLRSDEGYARVVEVVPGGPADRDGRLRVNDRIAAVAQGEKDFEDVMDMKLDKVVEKIRGEKGTTVRLLVVPSDAADPSKRQVIDIVRDEVKLKEQE
ncbi:MAG TPA: PDZ domain-containing protein, partial [Chthoniobacterales bacterium]